MNAIKPSLKFPVHLNRDNSGITLWIMLLSSVSGPNRMRANCQQFIFCFFFGFFFTRIGQPLSRSLYKALASYMLQKKYPTKNHWPIRHVVKATHKKSTSQKNNKTCVVFWLPSTFNEFYLIHLRRAFSLNSIRHFFLFIF